MGLGHLLPWTPMLVWLLDALGGGVLPPAQAIYAGTLAVAVIVCLGFDFVDVLRWWRGERAPIGIA
jgi:Na+/H+ antiporter NhaC